MGAQEIAKKLETMRKKVYLLKLFPILVFMLALLLAIPGQIQGTKSGARMAFILLGMALIAAMAVSRDTAKVEHEFKRLYKDTFVKGMLETMLEDVSYNWHGGFTKTDVLAFGLAKLGNRFHSEDYLTGSYKGVYFRQADVTIVNEMVIENENHYEIYFGGRMLEFTFTGKAVQNVKAFSRSYNSCLNLGEEIIDLESVEFNSAFDVYSSDPLEAFYILTPQVMERLKRLQKKYDKIGFRFGKGKLCVAISGLNAFDVDYRNKISYAEEYDRVKKDVQLIKDMVEIVELMQLEEQ